MEGWIALPHILTRCFRQVGTKENLLISIVYGPPVTGEREDFLQSIRNLSNMYQEKFWLLGGDFNTILNHSENKGGIRREDPEIEQFRDLLIDIKLVYIPTVDGNFTWNNRRGETHQIASILDRFIASEYLVRLDVYYEVAILPTLTSYYWLIIIEIDIKENPKNRPFRFELFWLRIPHF